MSGDDGIARDDSENGGDAAPEVVPARMINEILYCERLFYLEWCQGEFAHNVFTVEGRFTHRHVDKAGGAGLPEVAVARGGSTQESDATSGVATSTDLPYKARSVWLTSAELGVTAKIDVVEGDGEHVVPIEYKRGCAPDVPEGAYLPERAQICVQVLLLRAHGFQCERGEIYFAKDRRRVVISVDEGLVASTLGAVARARSLAAERRLPPPLEDSPKCNGCSLAGICLPDELHLLHDAAAQELNDAGVEEERASREGSDEGKEPGRMRRLYAARDDRLPLYVQSHRARVSVKGERLIVWDDGTEREARIPNTSQVSLLGNAQITTPALRALLDRDIPVSLFSYGGWFLGRTTGLGSKNIELRIAQHQAAADAGFSLRIARRLVVSKILNSRTMLRRNHRAPDAVSLGELRTLANKAARADSSETLLGLEGSAARLYFECFSGMLKGEDKTLAFELTGRNRRPPRDPINALLSFCYALLVKDLTLAAHAAGLDPLLGFYHRPRHGRPALALDLMEEFRPLIADSVALAVVNNGVVGEDDFVRAAGSCALKPAARKKLIAAYERRMDQLITHPIFEYRLSYRRVLELQTRLLTRVILGELRDYPMFRTR